MQLQINSVRLTHMNCNIRIINKDDLLTIISLNSICIAEKLYLLQREKNK